MSILIKNRIKTNSFAFLISLIVSIIFNSCEGKSGNISENHWSGWKLNGAVKQLEYINYSDGGEYFTKVCFNKSGYVDKQEFYNPDQSLMRKWIYKYNNTNQQIQRSCYVLSDSLSQILINKYDDNGNLIAIFVEDGNGIAKQYMKAIYNKSNLKTQDFFYNMNGNVETKIIYQYNSQKRIIKETQFDNSIKKGWYKLYSYNKGGLFEDVIMNSFDSVQLEHITTLYSNKNQPIEIIHFNTNMDTLKRIRFKYTENGDLLMRNENINGEKTEFIYSYKYDDQNNWIFVSEMKNNEIINRTTRTIEYW
jgi:hypothetical protein